MPILDRKNSFASLKNKILGQNGKEYWRSIEEHADTPEFRDFISEEYPHEVEQWDNSLSRRNFVKVMGASLALAGVSGCVIQPAEKIVPYVRAQEGMLPGKANFYATAMSIGGIATGLLAKSFDGRPALYQPRRLLARESPPPLSPPFVPRRPLTQNESDCPGPLAL